jgi:immunity protein 5 of polymorphic toxin system
MRGTRRWFDEPGLGPASRDRSARSAEPPHLLAYFATIHDPRRAGGRQHPLVAILAIAARGGSVIEGRPTSCLASSRPLLGRCQRLPWFNVSLEGMSRSSSPRTRSEEDRRELILWAVACAERVLAVFEGELPEDERPRAALEGACRFAQGELRIGAARTLAVAAHAAARKASSPAATSAARACGQAVSVAHMAAHARGAAHCALKVVALTHADGAVSAVALEDEWQRRHLPARFFDFVYPPREPDVPRARSGGWPAAGRGVTVEVRAAHRIGRYHDRAVRENADALDRDPTVIEIGSSVERHGAVMCYGDGEGRWP